MISRQIKILNEVFWYIQAYGALAILDGKKIIYLIDLQQCT